MGIFDKLFGKKSNESEIKVGVENEETVRKYLLLHELQATFQRYGNAILLSKILVGH